MLGNINVDHHTAVRYPSSIGLRLPLLVCRRQPHTSRDASPRARAPELASNRFQSPRLLDTFHGCLPEPGRHPLPRCYLQNRDQDLKRHPRPATYGEIYHEDSASKHLGCHGHLPQLSYFSFPIRSIICLGTLGPIWFTDLDIKSAHISRRSLLFSPGSKDLHDA